MESRPPLPPFTFETAVQKVRAAEDGWNNRDPQKVAMASPQAASGATGPSSSRGATRSWAS
jgi:nuclear transport factor 2 (NTF2) superfamily protein